MSLEIDGTPILTLGDFKVLVTGLRDDAAPIGTLAAWRNYEAVDPQALHNTLDVTCRAFLADGPPGDAARNVIDAATQRLEQLPGVLAA